MLIFLYRTRHREEITYSDIILKMEHSTQNQLSIDEEIKNLIYRDIKSYISNMRLFISQQNRLSPLERRDLD